MNLFKREPMPATHVAIMAAFGLIESGVQPTVDVERTIIRVAFKAPSEELVIRGFWEDGKPYFVSAVHAIDITDQYDFDYRKDEAKNEELFDTLVKKLTGENWKVVMDRAQEDVFA